MANKQRRFFNHNTGKPVHYGSRMTGDSWIFEADSESEITPEDAQEIQSDKNSSECFPMGAFKVVEFSCSPNESGDGFEASWTCMPS